MVMELAFYLRPIAALLCVLVLIGGVAWGAKRFNIGQRFIHKASGKHQVTVEETHMLDMKRRLVLIRRGDTGHLLLLGPDTDIVVERNIDLSAVSKTKEVV